MDLTDAERSLLDFEREWWLLPTSKMSEIRTRFGFSASSYYRMLHQLVAGPAGAGTRPKTTTSTTKPESSTTKTSTTGGAVTTPVRAPGQVHLIVLNGGAASGEAAHTSSGLRIRGYTSQDTANTWSGHHQS